MVAGWPVLVFLMRLILILKNKIAKLPLHVKSKFIVDLCLGIKNLNFGFSVLTIQKPRGSWAKCKYQRHSKPYAQPLIEPCAKNEKDYYMHNVKDWQKSREIVTAEQRH